MPKYKTGLVIGRFQPFHKGHGYLVLEALKHANKLIIGIGSINQDDSNNPLTFNQVKQLLTKFIIEEGIGNKIIGVYGIPDFVSDAQWGKYVTTNLPHFDLVISNNDWTNQILKASGYTIIEVPFFKRELFEGKQIRQLFRTNKPWANRVPEYLIDQTKASLN